MKLTLTALAALLVSPSAFALSGDRQALSECLEAWGKHPFGDVAKVEFKTLSASVKVFGIGPKTEDDRETKKPALVLVKPAVNVLGGSTYRLVNPNGWYCMKANVNVLGKASIVTHCKSHLATTGGSAHVLSAGEDDGKTVTVLGSTKVTREGCAKKGSDDAQESDKSDD